MKEKETPKVKQRGRMVRIIKRDAAAFCAANRRAPIFKHRGLPRGGDVNELQELLSEVEEDNALELPACDASSETEIFGSDVSNGMEGNVEADKTSD